MYTNNLKNDSYNDYVIAIESTTEPNEDFELVQEGKINNELRFLRFRACLQTFMRPSRNRRMWHSKFAKPMFNAPEIKELLSNGGVPGESGHPVPDTGEVTIERILTIEPLRVSHAIKKYFWPTDMKVDGEIETVYDKDGPGCKFMWNIMQGLPVSFSTRSVIPQRKNIDGSIEQTGIGRYVTSDRVYLPGLPEAYIDKTIPVKDICKKTNFQKVMESYTDYVVEASEKVKRITDGLYPAMEHATIGDSGMISIPTEDKTIIGIYPELKYRREISDIMNIL